MNALLSDKILSALRAAHGNAAPELRVSGLYQLAVAVVLSAQTTDRQVNAATPALFERYPDFAALSRARLMDVMRLVKSTGFYRMKARHIMGMARMVMEDFGGELPRTREDLMRLPGVGRKSANVILSFGFGTPAIAVDTHVGRVARRLGYSDSEDPLKVEAALAALLPERAWIESHLLFIRHGRTLCRARSPLCGECPVSSFCRSAGKTR